MSSERSAGNSDEYPKGGYISEDLLYPDCPHCDKNRNGQFTERSVSNQHTFCCVKCRARWNPPDETGGILQYSFPENIGHECERCDNRRESVKPRILPGGSYDLCTTCARVKGAGSR